MHAHLISTWLLASIATISHASAIPQFFTSPKPTSTSISSSPGVWNGCTWTVDKKYKFNSHLQVLNSSWTSRNFNSSNSNSMYFIKDDTDAGPGYFNSSQIAINSAGQLQLNVAAVPTNGATDDAQSAQIRTAWSDIKYGSVRTVAKGTLNPGAVYGAFFYGANLTHDETDIELRTTYPDQAYFTNQNDNTATDAVNVSVGSIADWHEYRIDWVPGSVTFYVNGALKLNLTRVVPQVAGPWYWNAWSNRGPWSVGPARQANTFTIQSIDMYVNRTGLACGSK